MPVAPTYPGVYIEEVPSGVRTITGVATSITAFIGAAARGPVNTAVTINSYADFERTFGGLAIDSSLGFAVRDFYRNGGSQAVIVRLYQPVSANETEAPITRARLAANGLNLEAAYEGAWGNALRVRIDHDVKSADSNQPDPTLFNLSVRDGTTGEIEIFRNVSVSAEHVRRLDNVLLNESKLVRVFGTLPNAKPAPHDAGVGVDIWRDHTPPTSTAVEGTGFAANSEALTNTGNFTHVGAQASKQGLYALEQVDLFNLLCIPPYHQTATGLDVEQDLISAAAAYCEQRRAMLLIDSPSHWLDKAVAKAGIETDVGEATRNAALFFPRLRQPNPLRNNQEEDFAACGAVAGLIARTDTQRGVWKAPAGLEATLTGVPKLSVSLTDLENGELNPLGINCIRAMPAAGRVIWGARTRVGDDRLASEWKYIPVRRTALFIEESLYRGTQWVVFEPNDEGLWAQIRLNVGAFMHNLFRQGAFQGSTPRDAYFVKCDRETTTQNDINLGIVNILVGFAPLKPAEFVIVKLQQMAGQIAA